MKTNDVNQIEIEQGKEEKKNKKKKKDKTTSATQERRKKTARKGNTHTSGSHGARGGGRVAPRRN